MKYVLCVLAAVTGLSSTWADAKVVSFPGDNFSIDVPADWEQVDSHINSEHAHAATAGKDPKNSHFYSVLITESPSPFSPSSFLSGMQSPLLKKGWKASEIRDMTINGKPFSVFTMTREAAQPPFMLLATTFTKENIYTVQVGLPSGNVEEAPDLKAIVQSFQFLKPVETFNRNETINNVAYERGRIVGQYFGALLVGGILLFFFFKAVKAKR